MSRVWYAVIATLPDQSATDDYVGWLRSGHLSAVLAGGATTAQIIAIERTPNDGLPAAARRVMTQYAFPDRQAFDDYVAHHAPALRADGLSRFGPDRGVRFERLVGEIS